MRKFEGLREVAKDEMIDQVIRCAAAIKGCNARCAPLL
jgi:hypothetical protein